MEGGRLESGAEAILDKLSMDPQRSLLVDFDPWALKLNEHK